MRSLESIKVEPRLTSRLISTLASIFTCIFPVFYPRELTCVAKNASLEISPQGIVRVH